MAVNTIPSHLIDYMVFASGNRQLGTADITMPKITYKNVTINGAGIAGDVDMPTKGHTENMEVEINWRTTTSNAVALGEAKAHDLEFRGAQEMYDAGTGEYSEQAVKVNVRAIPKEVDLGKLSESETTDAKSTLTVVYLKVTIDGKVVAEIDKFNYICNINGSDALSAVRSALGI